MSDRRNSTGDRAKLAAALARLREGLSEGGDPLYDPWQIPPISPLGRANDGKIIAAPEPDVSSVQSPAAKFSSPARRSAHAASPSLPLSLMAWRTALLLGTLLSLLRLLGAIGGAR